MSDKINFLFKSPEESPGYLLAQLMLLWQRKHKKVLDPLDLTQTQFVLLSSIAWLTNKSDNVTQVEIANLNNFDRMMVSKVLRTLQTKKLIIRQEHETDTRAKIVRLTSHGEKVLQLALTKIENADIEFFSSIGDKLSDFNSNMYKLIEANKNE
ncbi:MarR family transcriptional regulator [Flavobacterium sp. NRK F10]|uniref:MarR family transcriptional regulator n=1 Tax=Flavobacterium sediminis TaxID=2201181 RepID=A0A2U8QRU4_9FLAO|nr:MULTISPECIES: MarR family transcriptional regulator [Flavobacterium]AWM12821.1 MarR family transcriptional regulator [Flavobacterium sediminis]MCO6173948.1 MarR family transcriptional regulator [Flavobacterium sp. NRK F10]